MPKRRSLAGLELIDSCFKPERGQGEGGISTLVTHSRHTIFGQGAPHQRVEAWQSASSVK
jgi:hypothetical protein